MSVHHGHRLKFLIDKRKGNIAQIAANLNVARGTLYNYFEQEEIPKKKLLKVCEAAGIDINEVLDTLEMQEPASDYRALQERVRSLYLLEAADELIAVNKRRNNTIVYHNLVAIRQNINQVADRLMKYPVELPAGSAGIMRN